MDNSIKKFFTQFSHYTIAEILVFVAGFISFPILTRLLSTEEYGSLSLVTITLWLFMSIAKGGLQESAVRFFGEYNIKKDNEDRQTYYATFFYGSIILALFICLLVVLSGPALKNLFGKASTMEMVWILSGLIFTGTMSIHLLNFMRAEQRTRAYNTIVVLKRYSNVLLGIAFLFWISRTVRSLFLGHLIADSAILLLLILLSLRRFPLKPTKFSSSLLKTGLIFGFPLIGFELGHFLIKSSDRYIIQFLMGAETVGLFSAAANICHYAKDLILFPLTYAITPIYLEIWQTQGESETERFISKITRITLFLVIPILFGFGILSKDIMVVLASEKFIESGRLIPLIIPGTVLWGLSPLFAAGLYIQKKTATMTQIVMLGVTINVGMNLLLIPVMGMMGAALATLVSYTVLSGILVWVSSKTLHVSLSLKPILVSLAASLVMTGTLAMFGITSNLLFLAAKIILGTLIYASIVVLILPDARKPLWVQIKSLVPVKQMH